jgi:hypothetical protein
MIEMVKRHEIQVLRRAGHTWMERALTEDGTLRSVELLHRARLAYSSTSPGDSSQTFSRMERPSALGPWSHEAWDTNWITLRSWSAHRETGGLSLRESRA